MSKTGTASVDRVAPLERDAAPSLVAAIGDRLQRLILGGDIPAGGKLNEHALAQQLGVSRSALREAVRRLEQSGLVTIIPNRGVFVRRIGVVEALDLFDVHAGLARTAGRLVATRATSEQIEQLEALHREMLAAKQEQATDRYYALNSDFHNSLMAFTRNDRLIAFYEMISSGLQLFRRRNLRSEHQIEASVVEHEKILDAIKAGDAERAARVFERHVLGGKQRMLDSLPSGTSE